MSATIGSYQIDLWDGPAPPAVKSSVDLIYRPGQSTAAAKVLPNQSNAISFRAIEFVAYAGSHAYADGYRALIGTVVALTYGGVSWGNVLVQDVTLLEIAAIIGAAGIHPSGVAYSHWPAARITSQWTVVRLSV